MSRASVWTLRFSSAWSIWVWSVLVRNMMVDHSHSVGFRTIHVGLAIISFGFAVATMVIAQRISRHLRPTSDGHDPTSLSS